MKPTFVELIPPFPNHADLAARLVAESNAGGVALWYWREGLIAGKPIEDISEETMEYASLENPLHVEDTLDDILANGVEFRPAVRFKDESRARMFQEWLDRTTKA